MIFKYNKKKKFYFFLFFNFFTSSFEKNKNFLLNKKFLFFNLIPIIYKIYDNKKLNNFIKNIIFNENYYKNDLKEKSLVDFILNKKKKTKNENKNENKFSLKNFYTLEALVITFYYLVSYAYKDKK